mgnify:CR=1 FL=1
MRRRSDQRPFFVPSFRQPLTTTIEDHVAKLSNNQLFYVGVVAGALAAAAFVIPLTVVVSNSLS